MRKIAQELQFYSTLFLMNNITEYLGDSQNKEFVEFIINPIEDEVSKPKIPTFIIPLIVSLIDKKVIIYALYAYFSKLHNDWYPKVFEILNHFNDIIIEKYYNDLIQMSAKLLSDLKDKSYQEEKVEQMKKEILKEIQYVIDLIDKFLEISTKKARENICKKMDHEIIRYQIDQYKIYLKPIKQNKYKNKYHIYLYSPIIILVKMYTNYINAPECQKIESKGFNADKTLTNTNNLYESIGKELKLGHGDWVNEAWIAFVYCFNKRMSYLNIHFDPKDDYKDAKYRITIGEALQIIEQFYPIYRIRNF